MEENIINEVTDVVSEVSEMKKPVSAFKGMAIGAGVTLLAGGAVYGIAKLVKKGIAKIKRNQLKAEAEDLIDESCDDEYDGDVLYDETR